MATVMYGICSEGMGHATRSSAVIDHLLSKGHRVIIFTSGRAYKLLSKKYPDVHRIVGFDLIHKQGGLDFTSSLMHTIKKLPSGVLPSLRRMFAVVRQSPPDIVVSDYEALTCFVGNMLHVTVISANNVSILRKTRIDYATSLLYHDLMLRTTEQFASYRSDYYVIPTFFFPPARSKNVILTNPTVRPKIVAAKPTRGKHVLVYHTSKTMRSLLAAIREIDDRFVIYGFGKQPSTDRMRFHEFNEEQFVEHLASARAVITGGGFSLISEALYLKKPILSMPMMSHIEQTVNALKLQELKYGEYCAQPSAVAVQDFLLKLPLYDHYLAAYSFDPTEFQRKILALIEEHAQAPSPTRIAAFYHLLHPIP